MNLHAFFRKAARLEYDEAAIWYESQSLRTRSASERDAADPMTKSLRRPSDQNPRTTETSC